MRHVKFFIVVTSSLFLLLLSLFQTCFAQPPPPDRLQIVSVTIRDDLGNVITSASRGDFIFVDVVMQNTDPYASQPFLLVARLSYGSPPTLAGLSGYRGSLAGGGQTEPTPGFQIPVGGPTGTYTIKVLVFTNWPASGGTVVAIPVSTTIGVS